MNSLWLVITALAAFAVAYRYFSAFLAAKVAVLDDSRTTPAYRLRDGVDYHPTNKMVLFGHHFAAIAGPGPLIGPVMAAQWGYAPGFCWIVIGACLCGGVHDFVTLWASVREDGLSLPWLARKTVGRLSGITTSIATLFIIVCTLASVAKVVVMALAESSWGMFTILVTIPAALLTGLWMYKIRPGKIAEASALGVAIVLAGVILGEPFSHSGAAHWLKWAPETLSIVLPCYALVASILPVWVLMCPRDYLSSYMKIGVILVLGVGIFVAHPTLHMPAVTSFVNGGGPVVPAKVWPFVCIVIMCGAISGFHSLIASGTTPKMVQKESHVRSLGYGAMVLEGFVSVTALIAACSLHPGDYFAMNVDTKNPVLLKNYSAMFADPVPGAAVGTTAGKTDPKAAVEAIRKLATTPTPQTAAMTAKLGFDPLEHDLTRLERETQETLHARPGGAVTLAVGMASVFERALPMVNGLVSYWYHFVIMFEALFILTLLETGTRVARFVFQETVSQLNPKLAMGGHVNWGMNIGMSVLTCFCWGFLLYNGKLDTLWRMLGISNQLLASIALVVGTTYLLLHAPRRRYALLTFFPLAWLLTTVLTAGYISVGQWWQAAAKATVPRDAFMGRLSCYLATTMLLLTVVIAVDAVRRWIEILRSPREAGRETP